MTDLVFHWDHAAAAAAETERENTVPGPRRLEPYLEFLAQFRYTDEELRRVVVFKERFTLED